MTSYLWTVWLIASCIAVLVQALSTRIAFLQNALGSALAPFDCWLLLRGVKTMAVSSNDNHTALHCVVYYALSHILLRSLCHNLHFCTIVVAHVSSAGERSEDR